MSNLPRLGIDIGSTTTKMVELVPAGKDKWKLVTAASMPSFSGGIAGNPANLGSFSQALIKMRKEAGVRATKVIAALPEGQVDRAVWSHQVIRKDPTSGGMEVMLVAAAKNLVNAYVSIMEQAGLEVVALETELMAISRAMVPSSYPTSLIIDVGSKSTNVGVVEKGQLVFARTIPTAGEALTRAIQSSLGLELSLAEQYKVTYGLDSTKLGGKLVEAMKPVLNVISSEIRKTADFYTSKHSGQGITLATLTGGVAMMPEMVAMLSGAVGMEMSVGDPFIKLVLDKPQQQALATSGPLYGVAVGLGMRDI